MAQTYPDFKTEVWRVAFLLRAPPEPHPTPLRRKCGNSQSHPASIPGRTPAARRAEPLGLGPAFRPPGPLTYLGVDPGDGHERERKPVFPHLRKREESETKGAGPRADPGNFFRSRRLVPSARAPQAARRGRATALRAHHGPVRGSGGRGTERQQGAQSEGGSFADQQPPRKFDLGSPPLKTPPSPTACPPAPPILLPLLQQRAPRLQLPSLPSSPAAGSPRASWLSLNPSHRTALRRASLRPPGR